MIPGYAIKGVLFDVDGTMYRQLPMRMTMVLLLLLLNLHRPAMLLRVLKVISAYRNAQEILRREPHKVLNPAFRQLQVTADATGESLQFVKSVIQKWFESMPLRVLGLFKRRDLIPVLDELSAAGIKLGVYSDYPVSGKLKVLGISQCFSVALSAADENVVGFKPRSNGFELAAGLLKLETEKILYVGDRPEIDGVGAEAAGMCAIIVRSPFRKGKQHPYRTIKSIRDLLMIVSGEQQAERTGDR
jgi:HAD superfamily hydrolase (TIGR01549 family)